MTRWAEKHKKKTSAKDLIPIWFLEAKKKNYSDEDMNDIIRANFAKDYPNMEDYQVELILTMNNELYNNI